MKHEEMLINVQIKSFQYHHLINTNMIQLLNFLQQIKFIRNRIMKWKQWYGESLVVITFGIWTGLFKLFIKGLFRCNDVVFVKMDTVIVVGILLREKLSPIGLFMPDQFYKCLSG